MHYSSGTPRKIVQSVVGGPIKRQIGACNNRAPSTTSRSRHHSSNVAWQTSSSTPWQKSNPLASLPQNVLILRHGESMGNQDESLYTTTPDWKVPLSRRGRQQARQAGKRIQNLIGNSLKPVIIYVSPYLRTKQTVQELGLLNPVLYTREEPRLREQDFGNFQDPDQIAQAKRDRSKFGRFFFRFPAGGESGADVFDRVSSFCGTFIRDMEQLGVEQARKSTAIFVTHGITGRMFVMKWFHWSVDEFEALYNPPNCGILHMTRTLSSSVSYQLTEESRNLIRGPIPHDESGVGRALKLGEWMKQRRRRGLLSLEEKAPDVFDFLPESGAQGL